MRIVAGESRGRKLFTPKNDDIRPTSDRVRQALFNILGFVNDFVVLDLFSGSGALGLEALSRGAKKAYFVDSSYTSITLTKRNVELLGYEERAIIWKTKAVAALEKAADQGISFDLVLIDPPYKSGEIEKILTKELLPPVLGENCRVVLETSVDYPPDLSKIEKYVTDKRKYGGTLLFFLDL